MKKELLYILSIIALGLNDSAFSADASGEEKFQYKDNGGYEDTQHTEKTTADGTSRTADSKINVDVSSKGLATQTVKTKTVDDPPGVMNRKTDTTTTQTTQKARGGYQEQISHKHTDAAGTNINEKASTDVDVDKSGNVTENTKAERTVNPKGIFNKKTTIATQLKAVNGQVVEKKEESN